MDPPPILFEELLEQDNEMSLLTDGFMVGPDQQMTLIDPGQRFVSVKVEREVESKATEEAVRRIQMGHEFINNQHLRQPTLQDAVEDTDILFPIPEQQNLDKFHSISNIGELQYDELHQVIYSLTDDTPVEIKAIPSKKKKNPPYMVKEKHITTSNETPVTFTVSGAKLRYSVHVSMRYTDEIYKKKAVKPCKIHQDCKEKPENLPPDFNFYLTRDCKYSTKDNHPTAIIDIHEGNVDPNEICTFSIVFLCLNSCHKRNGKKTEVFISVHDSNSRVTLQDGRFTLRICKNVKRDHKEKNNFCLKRGHSGEEEYEGEASLKSQRGEYVISQDQRTCDGTSESNQGKPNCYGFQMQSRDNEDLILRMIAALDGKYYPLQTSFEDIIFPAP